MPLLSGHAYLDTEPSIYPKRRHRKSKTRKTCELPDIRMCLQPTGTLILSGWGTQPWVGGLSTMWSPSAASQGDLGGKLDYKIRTTVRFRDPSRDVSGWRHNSPFEQDEERLSKSDGWMKMRKTKDSHQSPRDRKTWSLIRVTDDSGDGSKAGRTVEDTDSLHIHRP